MAGLYLLLIKMDKKLIWLKISTILSGGLVLVFLTSLYLGDYYARSTEDFPTTTIDSIEYSIIDLYDKGYYLVKNLEDSEKDNEFEIVELKEVKEITY
ncbi:hypothetical protein AB1K91_11080 [Terribacillus sp. 179-K 1B1 HS]